MPLFPFECSECGLEFDVSRAPDDLERPADCPLDGSAAQRNSGFARMQRVDGSEVQRRRSASRGSFLHDHGPGTLPHLHGPGMPFHSR
jgi:putative FmdB family regulatory protein